MLSSPDVAATVVVLPAVGALGAVSDERLLELEAEITAARRRVDAARLAVVTELVRRSDPARGHDGLAARLGVGSPEKAIQSLTGVSKTEAKDLTIVALASGDSWLDPVGRGVADGSLSVASAAAIAAGRGQPTSDVAPDDLLDAAHELVAMAPSASPESLATSARRLREQLDAASVASLEEHRRSRRSLTWHQQADGMTRLTGLLDPESAAILTGALETALSPRRGGPRFVDPEERAAAEAVASDPRSTPQLALDTLVDLVQVATRAVGVDGTARRIFGTRTPAVRVHVPLSALESGQGAAWLEGQSAGISVTTAEKHICVSGVLPILFSGSRAIDAGATQRLHSPAQRAAMAAQWGGCAWPECDRPPGMTEAHHIESWNGRNTTLRNGVPLCRFHHHELHANGWRIELRGAPPGGDVEHWLVPPASAPGRVEARPMRGAARLPSRPLAPKLDRASHQWRSA